MNQKVTSSLTSPHLRQEDDSYILSIVFFLTMPAEYPCGRTALADASASSRRSKYGGDNSSLHTNITSLNSSNYSTTSPPSTSAAPTEPPPARNESAKIVSRKKLPQWALEEAASSTKRPSTPFKRIVGGEVVIPGEIPWQVF